MKKLSIRFIVPLGGEISYQAMEIDKKGEFVFYDFDAIEAMRLIDADYATPKSKAEYEKMKANIKAIQEEADKKKELLDTIENLSTFKLELEAKELEVKELKAKIAIAEKAVKGK